MENITDEYGTITIGADALEGSQSILTITDGSDGSTTSYVFEPQFVDQEILEYNVSDNRKSIEIIVKQAQAWGQSFIGTTPNSFANERVIKRIYKVRNGKLKLFKEEIGEVIPPQHIPESYRFNEEKK